MIVQFSTGGAVSDSFDARLAPLQLVPEMATLTTGSVNFGDEVFSNPQPFVERLYARMRELRILPEFEIFDAGMIAGALDVAREADHPLHFDLVLGVPGGMPAWDDAVAFLTGHLPAGSTWSATGIGRAHLQVTTAALETGGHVRTGLEDVAYFDRGRPADSNAQLIARVARMARDAGREPATPALTREILGLGRGPAVSFSS